MGVLCGEKATLIRVISIVTLLISPLISPREPPSKGLLPGFGPWQFRSRTASEASAVAFSRKCS